MSATDQLKNIIKRRFPDQILFRFSPHVVRGYAKAMTWYTCGRRYDAPVDPLQLIELDPLTVTKKTTATTKKSFRFSDTVSEVVDGDWDSTLQPIEAYDLYRAFEARFLDGDSWESTDFYQRRAEIIRAGEPRWGCESIEQFHHRLDEIEALYESIKDSGYRTQRELRKSGTDIAGARPIHNYWPPELHEVIVDVDRNGNFILHEGRHRFAIARLLKCESIPVRIKVRHVEWQQTREAILNGREESKSHPDVTQTII